MTPTEQAADRVKALVERLRAPDEFNNRGPDYEPMIIPPSALRLEAADLIEALTAERDGLREARDQEDIGPPTPLGALKFRMEQGGHTQNDLAKLIGNRARASEILSGKRALSKAQIATLADAWGIPARSLLGPTPPAPHSDGAGS